MLICKSCGRDNPTGAGFCNSCGAALASPAASREVRKTVTVLFCDLTGSTALGEQTDPEAQIAGDDGYRFRHLLIRDAAYDALPKAVRADLHVRFADWLDEHGHTLVGATRSSATTSNRRAVTERSSGNQTPPWPTAPPGDSLPPAIARSTAGSTGTAPHC